VHPWHGQVVTILRSGSDAVWVEREFGEVRIIPISWTSLRKQLTSRHLADRGVRLAPDAALRLARWVAARRNGEES
jgi:hypothetical protein